MSAVHKSASPGQGDTLFRQIVDCRRGGAAGRGRGGQGIILEDDLSLEL